MLLHDMDIIATGKKEYSNGEYPTKYYLANANGLLFNVSRETYDRYENLTELIITFYKGDVYYKEKTLKKGE